MKKAGDVLLELFRDKYGYSEVKSFEDIIPAKPGIFSSWESIMEKIFPEAAFHSKIRELERGILYVEADHPGWVQILQTKQKDILLEVQKRYPELDIKSISLRLGRG